MKRLAITLQQLAARENLLLAVAKAARGKRQRPEVARWLAELEPRLADLAQGIMDQTVPSGRMRRFTIHDPKTRVISTTSFADRVLHHAILNLAEPRFEKMLVDSSFACRPGLGVHAAVAAVQRHLRRFDWWVQVDVAGYFASIDHGLLRGLLARRFKGEGLLALLGRIIARGAPAGAGCGLPIGALSSQHFANAYLDAADRWLLARPDVQAHVRYMDDIVWWCASRDQAQSVLAGFRVWLALHLRLQLKPQARVGRSAQGIAFCGFRVRRGVVLPSARKQRRFRQGARAWMRAFHEPGTAEGDLQRAHEVLQATLAHTRSVEFRRRVWARVGGYSEPP